jgi:type IX secretion system PorP/SprF family membrane protein
LFAAYHLSLGYTSNLSVGLSGAFNSRSVDFSKLKFDSQWDGFKFNTNIQNGESGYVGQASYWDVGAGLAWAFFPNENLYIQVSGGAQHINRPTESFYNGSNQLGIRPTGHVDVLYKATPGFIINPSAYYTRQKGSQNLVAGAQTFFGITGTGREAQQLILGAYYRLADAVIATAGYQWTGMRLVSSYDVTLSGLKKAVPGAGAFEMSFVYEGLYSGGRAKPKYNCPRF